MTIKERLKKYCEYRHTTIGTFCRMTGISGSYFNQVKERVSVDIQRRIKDSKMYPDLNLEWLNTGKGEMLLYQPQAAIMTPYPTNNITTGNVTGSGNNFVAGNNNATQPHIETVEAEEVKLESIPIVAPSVTAVRGTDIQEYVEQNADELEHLDLFKVIEDPDFVERISGMSMYPTLKPSDVVLIKILPDKTIVDGKMYYLNTKNWPTMVRTVKVEGNKLRLIAENPNFGDIVIDRNDLIRIGRVVCMIRKTLGDYYGEVEAIRRKKDEQIETLITNNGKANENISRLIDILEKKC